ncbi:hypothetical protein CW702_02900 [Candidatus Bathyarchaeota archaeon]|nr:MAG: hypothetical protein CW702_02900 [Candidatus Bathyarchaeota archaeon]
MAKIKVTLLTGRTIEQGKWKELGKLSSEYMENVAICEIDPEDLKLLGIKEGKNVKVTTKFGSVVVRARKSRRRSHPGSVFIPYGPWASLLVSSETNSTGMPSLKGLEATIEPTDESVPTVKEIILTYYRKEEKT